MCEEKLTPYCSEIREPGSHVFRWIGSLPEVFQSDRFEVEDKHVFRQVKEGKVFDRATVFLQLIVHLLLGFRELQDARYYRDDPLVNVSWG